MMYLLEMSRLTKEGELEFVDRLAEMGARVCKFEQKHVYTSKEIQELIWEMGMSIETLAMLSFEYPGVSLTRLLYEYQKGLDLNHRFDLNQLVAVANYVDVWVQKNLKH